MISSTPRDGRPAAACAALAFALAVFAPSTAAAAEPAAGQQAQAPSLDHARKLNAHTEAYNKLIDSFGLPEVRKTYFEKRIATKSPSDHLFISSGRIGEGLAALKRVRQMPAGGMDPVDQAAGALAGLLEPLTGQLRDLGIYYESKAYKDDMLARGKAEDPIVRAGLDACMAALKAYSEALDREHGARDERAMATLKAQGHARLYNIKLGLRQAQQMIKLFTGPDELRNAGNFARGDLLVAQLEQTLAEQRATNAAMPGRDANVMNHESVASHLTSLAGAYRELKQSQRVRAFNDMVHRYNAAVDAANSINE